MFLLICKLYICIQNVFGHIFYKTRLHLYWQFWQFEVQKLAYMLILAAGGMIPYLSSVSCHILHAACSFQALISAVTLSISTFVHFIIIVWIWILHLPQTGSPAHLEQVGWGKRLIFPRCGPDRGGGWARWWQPGSPRCASPPSPRRSPSSVANNFSGLRSWLRLLILTS